MRTIIFILIFLVAGSGLESLGARPSNELLGRLWTLEKAGQECARQVLGLLFTENATPESLRGLLVELTHVANEAMLLRTAFLQAMPPADSRDEALKFLVPAQVTGLIFQELIFVITNFATARPALDTLLAGFEYDPECAGYFHAARLVKSKDHQKIFFKELNHLLKNDLRVEWLAKTEPYLTPLRARIRIYAAHGGEVSSYQSLKSRLLGKLLNGRDEIREEYNRFEFITSRVFGNAAGALNIQKYLRNIPVAELDRLLDLVLEPGDILVEKTPGALTDNFIPGHFGHVALFIGRPGQLRALHLADGTPLLEHPDMAKHLEKLAAGETLLESVRPGVQLEDLRHWTVTDLAVLRPATYPRVALAEGLLRALKYVGTKYDFGFDADTKDLVYCSEVPVHSYPLITFRLKEKARRRCNDPDDVAVLAGPAGENGAHRPFQLVYFNHDCAPITPEKQFEMYRSILNQAGSEYDRVPENNHQYPGYDE